MEPIIKVDNVSMCFNLSKEKHESLKEYFLAMVQGRLQYDEFYALKDVSLDIMPGDFYGLVGLNGSGKSTLLKTIAGVYKPSKGKVTVNGTIAPLIELGAGFDMDLTARENIYLNGTVLGFSPKYLDEKFDEIVEFSELENFLDVPLKNYSSGMVARLAFAVATMTKPDILIADEILSVGDFLFQEKCEKRMAELLSGGTTVILVSHSIEQIERMCNKVAWLDHGHLRRLGPTKEVTAEYRKFEKKDAMKADGTINRAALPAIFNPEDLNALEQALRLKDAYPGTTVTLLTMGPGRAAEIIREGLYRGADGGFLLTDRAFAGADTLATSYALATAIKKINDYDIIIGGRQAIDGDTAQVGPQVAEKLGLTQITYAEEILNVDKEAGRITVKRHIDGGVETVEGPLPIVITVNGSAAPCRPRNAKLVQKYKHAMGKQERAVQPACHQDGTPTLRYPELYETRPYLDIQEWSVADVNGDLVQCGLSGSPTKVKAIENIVFQAKESKTISSADQEVEDLIVELLANHTIG